MGPMERGALWAHGRPHGAHRAGFLYIYICICSQGALAGLASKPEGGRGEGIWISLASKSYFLIGSLIRND